MLEVLASLQDAKFLDDRSSKPCREKLFAHPLFRSLAQPSATGVAESLYRWERLRSGHETGGGCAKHSRLMRHQGPRPFDHLT